MDASILTKNKNIRGNSTDGGKTSTSFREDKMNKANDILEMMERTISSIESNLPTSRVDEASGVLTATRAQDAIKHLYRNKAAFKRGVQRDIQKLMQGRKTRTDDFEVDRQKVLVTFGTYAEREGMRSTGSNPTAVLGIKIVPKVTSGRTITYSPSNAEYWVIKNPPPAPSGVMGYS